MEPTRELLGVGAFDAASEFPLRATCWRRAAETRVSWRNPLWDSRLRLTHDTLAIDVLHTLYLGPCLFWVGHCLWYVIDADLWGLGANASEYDRWQLNIQRARSLLQAFYAEHRRCHPDKPLTELEDFSLNMMGTLKGKLHNIKALETNHMAPFVLSLMMTPQSRNRSARTCAALARLCRK